MHISMSVIPSNSMYIHVKKPTPDLRERIRRAGGTVAKREAGYVKKMYDKFTATWWDYVEFAVKYETNGQDFRVTVQTDNMIFYFIDKGTSVRYATMTPDFEPKTAYHRVNSTFGKGGLAYINPHIPRPGIEARDITGYITDYRQPKFQMNMWRAVDRVVQKYWTEVFRNS